MDGHERTRAILWCLLDIDPSMPLAQALGYLKAVEDALDRAEAAAKKPAPPPAGSSTGMKISVGSPAAAAAGTIIDTMVRETLAAKPGSLKHLA